VGPVSQAPKKNTYAQDYFQNLKAIYKSQGAVQKTGPGFPTVPHRGEASCPLRKADYDQSILIWSGAEKGRTVRGPNTKKTSRGQGIGVGCAGIQTYKKTKKVPR